ncbi:MAG: hypothetical protein QNL88_08380 [Acidobacteriota bacterium]|nr:hypothetical protein [Acidobacteriota bacterium]
MQVEKPCRVSRSFTQHLCAPADEVFPLLCPVREMEWVKDWRPKLVVTESGVAEPGCIFVTPGIPEDALWLITVHDPVEHRLEITKIIPGMVVGTITVAFSADGDEACTADINYAYTALSEHGKRAIGEFTDEHFQSFMKTWEAELNHFLRTGERLAGTDTDQPE